MYQPLPFTNFADIKLHINVKLKLSGMRTLKFLIWVLFCLVSISVNGQTKQYNLHATVDHGLILCLADKGITVSGEWTLHFTYHVDKKTGKVDRIHYNVLSSYLKNDETGEEYFVIDTSTDNSNLWGGWDYMNNINAMNADYGIVYEVTDGFMDLAPNPGAGSYVETFKVISKSNGVIGSGMFLCQLHVNQNGDVTGTMEKFVLDCP